MTTLSIVIPMHNEALGLEHLFQRLLPLLKRMAPDFEIICVDDGSTDTTVEDLMQWHQKHSEITVIELSRNFGKEAALTAGLAHATGQAVIPLDADLQDPPEIMESMMDAWKNGYEVVLAQRLMREGDPRWKRQTAGGFYTLFNWLATPKIPKDVGDFRLMDRVVVETVLAMPERVRFNKGLFSWAGFKTTTVSYDRPARETGQSAWGLWKLWNFAIDGITAFSTLPLRIWTYIGFLVSGVSFLYGLFVMTRTLFFAHELAGYPSLLCVMLFLGGIQLISLGVIGEYIGRIFIETKQRPLYIVRRNTQKDSPP